MKSVFDDIQGEIEIFFDDLNWTYILIYFFVLYGIKHKEEFNWYLNWTKGQLKPFRVWIAGVIVILFFIFFKYLEGGLASGYISEILRSWIVVIVFNSVFSDKLKNLEE